MPPRPHVTALVVSLAPRCAALLSGAVGLRLAYVSFLAPGVWRGLFAAFFLAVAVGSWIRHALALRVAAALLMLAGFVSFFGILSPFDARRGYWSDWEIALQIAMAFAVAIGLGALGWIVEIARTGIHAKETVRLKSYHPRDEDDHG